LEDKIKENKDKFNEYINNKDNELKAKEDEINKKYCKIFELEKKLEDNKKEMNELNECKKKYTEILIKLNNYIHIGIKCEKCFEEPIIGYRYKCSVCYNYNLCQKCKEKNTFLEYHSHYFIKIKKECNNIIINDFTNNNNILINDINLNNKNEIYEKKEDKNESSSDIIKKFLDEKSKIDILTNELIKNYSNEKEAYELKLKEKENKIKLFKQAFPFEILNENEKILNVNFITDDENIHYSIICKNTDKLIYIIDQFYDKYPQYRKLNNLFRFKGKEIKMSNTLEENSINNNDIIIIKSY